MCTRKPAKSQTDRYFPALFKDTQSDLVVMFNSIGWQFVFWNWRCQQKLYML